MPHVRGTNRRTPHPQRLPRTGLPRLLGRNREVNGYQLAPEAAMSPGKTVESLPARPLRFPELDHLEATGRIDSAVPLTGWSPGPIWDAETVVTKLLLTFPGGPDHVLAYDPKREVWWRVGTVDPASNPEEYFTRVFEIAENAPTPPTATTNLKRR